ncbi:ABC transporter substrate-binding protein [Flavobacterium jejuense]|uniref:ABC transporter substrate-binding protein n=1 Tax=Flavobacterium jejuense TaxID=1544455 RepID=A0ABX0IVZ8_9FLAO|nr:ABC transporter substrate-binding protein [Flavobacterium jejuense]NHN28094.1 ABC transporter substrate-binding protein [Flavobacterium jejuense]
MKLGLLLPTSKIYPTLSIDFMSGLRLAFKEQKSEDIEILYQGIENGGNKDLITNELNKMVLQNQVDLNIVFANPIFTDEIANTTKALQRPVIITNMGANLPIFKINSPYVLINSLNLWESAFSAASFGIKKFGKKVAHGSYFYEAGYQLYQSFVDGVIKNEGEIVFNQIADFNPDPNDFSTFMKKVREENPDFLYLLYSERDAISFLNKLVQSSENGLFPIVTSGVMLNEEIVSNVDGLPKNIFNVCSWDKSLKNHINDKFTSELKEFTGKEANYFSLLGYECGMSIALGFNKPSWSKNGLNQFEIIKNNTFEGPRGKVDFSIGLGITQFDNHVFTLDDKGNTIQHLSINKIENRNDLILKSINEQRYSGWFQPYLCQ